MLIPNILLLSGTNDFWKLFWHQKKDCPFIYMIGANIVYLKIMLLSTYKYRNSQTCTPKAASQWVVKTQLQPHTRWSPVAL